MTPETALGSSVFKLYALITISLLAAAGAVLAVLGAGLKKNVASIWATYRGWLIMAPLLLGAVLLGRVPVIVFFSIVSIFGFKEFARATGLYRDWWMTGVVYIGIACVGVVSLVADPNTGRPGWYGLFMSMPIYAIALVLIIPIIRNRVQGQLQAIALAVVGFIYIGWMFGHVGFLANCSHMYGYVLFLVFAVELNDIAAFTCGRLLGRHPLRSNISPKKTWEGALGAVAVSLALPWALRFSFPHFQPVHLVLTGLIIGIGGQIGDLSISVIKRDIGIKDMGGAIKGHGGILDRIDSLIFTAPMFLHLVDYSFKHW